MIWLHKQRTEQPTRTRQAGEAAECCMAHYFERAFESSRDVDVLNGLRVPIKGHDAFQIDHLLIHRHGMVIVETKSVTTKVRINRRGEWLRHYEGEWKGMECPIQQAKRQAEALRALLIQNKARLRDRKLFGLLQGGFQHCPIECLAGISNDGIIERETREFDHCVLKAEKIVDRVRQITGEHARHGSLLSAPNGDKGNYILTDQERTRVCEFLKSRHEPLTPYVENRSRIHAGSLDR